MKYIYAISENTSNKSNVHFTVNKFKINRAKLMKIKNLNILKKGGGCIVKCMNESQLKN